VYIWLYDTLKLCSQWFCGWCKARHLNIHITMKGLSVHLSRCVSQVKCAFVQHFIMSNGTCTTDHRVLCAANTFYPQAEWAIPASTNSKPQSITTLGRYSFPVPLRVGGWVGLGELVKICQRLSLMPVLSRLNIKLHRWCGLCPPVRGCYSEVLVTAENAFAAVTQLFSTVTGTSASSWLTFYRQQDGRFDLIQLFANIRLSILLKHSKTCSWSIVVIETIFVKH